MANFYIPKQVDDEYREVLENQDTDSIRTIVNDIRQTQDFTTSNVGFILAALSYFLSGEAQGLNPSDPVEAANLLVEANENNPEAVAAVEGNEQVIENVAGYTTGAVTPNALNQQLNDLNTPAAAAADTTAADATTNETSGSNARRQNRRGGSRNTEPESAKETSQDASAEPVDAAAEAADITAADQQATTSTASNETSGTDVRRQNRREGNVNTEPTQERFYIPDEVSDADRKLLETHDQEGIQNRLTEISESYTNRELDLTALDPNELNALVGFVVAAENMARRDDAIKIEPLSLNPIYIGLSANAEWRDTLGRFQQGADEVYKASDDQDPSTDAESVSAPAQTQAATTAAATSDAAAKAYDTFVENVSEASGQLRDIAGTVMDAVGRASQDVFAGEPEPVAEEEQNTQELADVPQEIDEPNIAQTAEASTITREPPQAPPAPDVDALPEVGIDDTTSEPPETPVEQPHDDAVMRQQRGLGVTQSETALEIEIIPETPEQPKNPVHTVQSGDNLSRIAKDNDTSVKEILKLNPDIKNPDAINIGQEITLPHNGPAIGTEEWKMSLLTPEEVLKVEELVDRQGHFNDKSGYRDTNLVQDAISKYRQITGDDQAFSGVESRNQEGTFVATKHSIEAIKAFNNEYASSMSGGVTRNEYATMLGGMLQKLDNDEAFIVDHKNKVDDTQDFDQGDLNQETQKLQVTQNGLNA